MHGFNEKEREKENDEWKLELIKRFSFRRQHWEKKDTFVELVLLSAFHCIVCLIAFLFEQLSKELTCQKRRQGLKHMGSACGNTIEPNDYTFKEHSSRVKPTKLKRHRQFRKFWQVCVWVCDYPECDILNKRFHFLGGRISFLQTSNSYRWSHFHLKKYICWLMMLRYPVIWRIHSSKVWALTSSSTRCRKWFSLQSFCKLTIGKDGDRHEIMSFYQVNQKLRSSQKLGHSKLDNSLLVSKLQSNLFTEVRIYECHGIEHAFIYQYICQRVVHWLRFCRASRKRKKKHVARGSCKNGSVILHYFSLSLLHNPVCIHISVDLWHQRVCIMLI